jgi:membrane protein YdbS with pleckstrin-like domain
MATIDKYPIERAKIVKNTMATFISLLSTLGIGVIIFWTIIISLLKELFSLVLILMGAIMLILYFYYYFYYKKYYYDLTREYLIIKEGLISYKETTIPYYRIQDVYIIQDPLDQFFGISDIYISTASGQGYLNAHIDGLSQENAQTLKSEILKRLKIKNKNK